MNKNYSQLFNEGAISVPDTVERDALAARVVAKIGLLTEDELGQLTDAVRQLLDAETLSEDVASAGGAG